MHNQIVITTPVTPEYVKEQIQQLYVAYFNRPADPGGLAYWTAVYAQAASVAPISSAFSSSAEYVAAYLGLSNAQVVDQVYLNLFGRHAEAGGLAFWSNLLDQHLITVSNVVTQVAAGAQSTDAVAFHDKTLGAIAFTGALDTTPEVLAYNGAAANGIGKAFISSIVDDTTLAAQIDPAALQRTIDSMTMPPPPPLPVTVALTSGVDMIAPSASVPLAGNDRFNAYSSGSSDALSSNDSIDGGAGSDTLNIISTTGNALVVPQDVTVKNVESVMVTTGNAATIDATLWSGVNSLTVSDVGASNIGAASASDITLSGVLGTGSAVVNGGHNVYLTLTGALFGTDGVSVGKTIAPSGNITVNYTAKDTGGSGLLSVNGGTSVDVVQSHAHAANITATNAPVSVVGGALTTIVTVDNAAAVTASATAAGVVTNRVSVTDINSNSVTEAGHITTITVNNFSTLNISDNALQSLSLAGGNGDITIFNDFLATPISKTLQLNLNGMRQGALTDANIFSTMHINASGADSTLSSINDTALSTLTLDGNKHLTLASGGTLPALKTVTVSGAAGLSANFSGIGITSFDASATSGSNTVTLDGSKGDYIGGSGADIVTLSAVSASHSVKVGLGADRVTLAAASTGLNTYTSILDPHAGLTLGFADKGTETFTSAKLVLGSTATFHDYADGVIAAGANAATNGAIGWFQFGGDTFVVESRHNGTATASFVDGTDMIVRLAGVVDLTHATFANSEMLVLV